MSGCIGGLGCSEGSEGSGEVGGVCGRGGWRSGRGQEGSGPDPFWLHVWLGRLETGKAPTGAAVDTGGLLDAFA